MAGIADSSAVARTPTTWLGVTMALHWLAIGSSLIHSLADVAIFMIVTPLALIGVPLVVAVCWWWIRSLSALRGDGRSGAVAASLLALLWAALANGGAIVFCLPPCGGGPLLLGMTWGDAVHIGSIVFGVAAAALTAQVAARRIRLLA